MRLTLFFLIMMQNQFCFSQEKIELFFESNQFTLIPKENKVLQDWIVINKNSKILAIHGFTDDDGDVKFNDSLAQKRVQHVFKIIQNKIKIRDDYQSISFGENFEQSPTKSLNRKITIIYLKEKDIFKEQEILERQNKIAVDKPVDFPTKIKVTNPNGKISEYDLDIQFMAELNSAKKGEKISLQNLNFIVNTFAIVNESRGKLYQLLLVLQQNKKLKIDIQGHLCCVGVDKKDLSTQRAKAIYKFLEFNGIDKNRMSYQGFGSTKSLFFIPEKNELERETNRRVEIEIIDN